MKILVLGGTGTVGSQVVRELLDAGADVSVLTRSEKNVEKLPRQATAEIGDLQDPTTVRRIFDGKDGVFLINAVSRTETNEGLMAINGLTAAGVKKVVYVSVVGIEDAPHLPHFGSKMPIEFALKRSGADFTILRPNNFYQNDLWFREPITAYGVYPQPLGSAGTNRVDVGDIAKVASAALTSDAMSGESIHVAGPEALTGEGSAEIWSTALGKPVAYGGDDMDAWEEQAKAMLPDWMAYDFRLMYEYFQKEGLRASESELERLTEILGRAPRSYEDFVKETASAWTEASASESTAA